MEGEIIQDYPRYLHEKNLISYLSIVSTGFIIALFVFIIIFFLNDILTRTLILAGVIISALVIEKNFKDARFVFLILAVASLILCFIWRFWYGIWEESQDIGTIEDIYLIRHLYFFSIMVTTFGLIVTTSVSFRRNFNIERGASYFVFIVSTIIMISNTGTLITSYYP